MTLYDFTGPVKELYELLQAEEIDEQTYNDTVEGLGVEDKIEDYCHVIREREADAEKFRTEAARCTKHARAAENDVKRLKAALARYYAAVGKSKDKAGTFSLSVRKSSRVDIYDESLVPAEYYTDHPTISKTLIQEAFDRGEIVPGAQYSDDYIVRIS